MTNFHYAQNTNEMIEQIAYVLNSSNAVDCDAFAERAGASHRATVIVYNGQNHQFIFNAYADCEEFYGRRAAVMANEHANEILQKAMNKARK